MALSDLERVRFARHLLLPEIGLSGQEKLVRTWVHAARDADAGSLTVAREYLQRAGVTLTAPGTDERGALDLPTEASVSEFAGSPELLEAARALKGSLAAVEAIKRALELGQPLDRVPAQLSSEDV